MRKIALKFILFLAFMVVISISSLGTPVLADSEFIYTDHGDGTATITSYGGTDTDVVIPGTLNTLTVVGIGNNAFQEKNLNSVTIPDHVRTIGTRAFSENNLTSVILPDGLTTVGDIAFFKNKLSSVTIPGSVLTIGESAFRNNALTSATIMDGVTKIGFGAFWENNLTSIILPDSVTEIGDNAFLQNQLTSVTLPDNETNIGFAAFQGNELTTITIPERVPYVGEYAFSTNNLSTVIVKGSGTVIKDEAFSNNQSSPANLTIIGHDSSHAQNYAANGNHTFHLLTGLSGLELSEGSLDPAFASGTENYTATVANSVDAIEVTPTVADDTAAVTVNGKAVTSGSASDPIALYVGPNTITVEVTAQDSTTKTYTIVVTRAVPDNNDDKNPPVRGYTPVVKRYVMTLTVGENTPHTHTFSYEQKDFLTDVIELDDGDLNPGEHLDTWILSIPAETVRALVEHNPEGAVRLLTHVIDYDLPVSVLSGINTSDMTEVTLRINRVDPTILNDMEQAAAANDAKLAAVPIESELAVRTAEGKRILQLYDQYVRRTLVLEYAGDPDQRTGVRYNLSDRTFTFVPSRIKGEAAILQSRSGGIETVLVYPKSFADVDGTWSAEIVNRLGSKLIVFGKSATHFDPDTSVTRAEITAMLVRSLGLQVDKDKLADFSDVSPASWYSGVLAVASREGLVQGDGTGEFRPEDQITREETVVMMISAMRYANIQSKPDADADLSSYQDADAISSWAMEEMAEAVQTGLIIGDEKNQLLPNKNTSRAEAAAMIDRLLRMIGFIE